MRHLLVLLLIITLPAQASIFNLDDDTLDTISAPPEKPAVVPAKPAPAHVIPAPKPAARPVPVPSVSRPELPVAPAAATEAQKTSPFTAQFPLYQSAHAAHLRGDVKTAFPAFGRLLAFAKKQGVEESPFTLRARLLREQMRLAAGAAKDRAQAVRLLAKFAQSPQAGAFRADALLLLVKERMDAGDPRGAKPWVEKLARAVAQERGAESARKAEHAAFLAQLTPDIQAKVAPHASPWQAHPDIFGRAVRRTEAPGQVVDAACARWHLDEIEAQAAQTAGFLSFLDGDRAATKKAWARAAQLAPAPPGKATQNAGRKLAFAAKSGRMLAYAGEEGVFDPAPKTRERVVLAEYLFLGTEAPDLSQAEDILRKVVAADDAEKAKMSAQWKDQDARIRQSRGVALVEKIKWCGLSDIQRDYVETTLATVLHREGKFQEALAHFEAVFARISHNQVERRTVIAYGNAARLCGTDAQRQRAEELEKALVASPLDDPWAKLARLNRAMRLEEAGKKPEASLLWLRFGQGGGAFGDYARTRLPKRREK